MPKVPRSNVTSFPGAQGDMPMVPSEADLMMALAIMHGKGRVADPEAKSFDERFRGYQHNVIDRLNPNAQGQVEDRTAMTPSERTGAEAQSSLDFIDALQGNTDYARAMKGPPKNPSGLAIEAGIKDIEKRHKSTASLGVAGGSR